MAFVVPKIVLTPLLIASTTLAGRRWGALLSGWLMALPLTSGPIALFITFDLGRAAGVQTATGVLVGATAHIAFSAGYVYGSRDGWARALGMASVAYVATASVVFLLVPPDPVLLFALDLASILAGLAFLRGRRPDAPLAVAKPGRWDIPARAIVATTLVVAISALAPIIGGRAAGVIGTYPVYVSVLTTFAHRIAGPSQAIAVIRGLILGLPGFATFFLVLATTLPTWPVLAAFGLALLAAIAINVAILLVTIRRDAGAEAR